MTAFRKSGLCILALLALVALAAPATAQDSFPSRPIKFVVPLAAGGGIDFTARVTAQKLSEVIGQQVVVENQGGGGGSIGVNQVVRATPDGYTLLYHSVTGIVNAAVAKDLPFDYLRDLVPVALVTRFAAVMVINPTVPAKDLKEFIALAKANPGKYSYGSSGAGTGIHLASELFKLTAGVDIVHVPYRGNAGVMPDLLAGRIQMLIDGVPPAGQEHRGRLSAGARRVEQVAHRGAAERADHDRAGARLRGAVLDRGLCSGGDTEANRQEALGRDRQDNERCGGDRKVEERRHRGGRFDAGRNGRVQSPAVRALPQDRAEPEFEIGIAVASRLSRRTPPSS